MVNMSVYWMETAIKALPDNKSQITFLFDRTGELKISIIANEKSITLLTNGNSQELSKCKPSFVMADAPFQERKECTNYSSANCVFTLFLFVHSLSSGSTSENIDLDFIKALAKVMQVN